MEREEITGFRKPTDREHEMIRKYLLKEFSSDKNRVKCLHFLCIAVLVAWLVFMGCYALEKKSLFLLAAAVVGAAVWRRLFLTPGDITENAVQRYWNLLDRNYGVKQVTVLDAKASPLDVGGLSASIFADGEACTDKILLRTDMAGTVFKNQGRALLVKMPDGLYFRLFAYPEDWNAVRRG